LVKFFIKARPDKERTQEEGRPIFKDTEYVEIRKPGMRDVLSCHPVNSMDTKRFPDHYRAFKDRTSQDINEGTPLSEWPVMSRSMAEELSFSHVKTVEQLATMADSQVCKFMGLFAMKEKAKIWLEKAGTEKPLYELDKKCSEQQVEIDRLTRIVEDLLETSMDDDIPKKKKTKAKQTLKKVKRE